MSKTKLEAREEQDWEIERLRWARNLTLSVEERLNRATIRPFRPGIDDGPPMRSWDTMADYKAWCETLPSWMGYGQSYGEAAPSGSEAEQPETPQAETPQDSGDKPKA